MRHLRAVSVFALCACVGLAQETPTEREAARGVLKKMADLEKSLDVPAFVGRLTAPNAERDRVVARAKELMDSELLAVADDITKHPEIGFQETPLDRQVDRVPQGPQLRRAGWNAGSRNGIYRALQRQQRRAEPGRDPGVRRAARDHAPIPWRPAQRARPGGNGGGDCDRGVSDALEDSGQRGGVWDPR